MIKCYETKFQKYGLQKEKDKSGFRKKVVLIIKRWILRKYGTRKKTKEKEEGGLPAMVSEIKVVATVGRPPPLTVYFKYEIQNMIDIIQTTSLFNFSSLGRAALLPRMYFK